MKVLLAIDSSTASQLVVTTAATRPWPSGTVFCVMSVMDMGRWEGLPVLVEDAKHEAQSLVTHAMNKLTQSGQDTFSEVQSGLPKKAIPEYAGQWRADLVMVGSHGQSALTRFFLGSVAQAILRTAPCSVEIVRPSPLPSPTSPGMKILLATDGTRRGYEDKTTPVPILRWLASCSATSVICPRIISRVTPLAWPSLRIKKPVVA